MKMEELRKEIQKCDEENAGLLTPKQKEVFFYLREGKKIKEISKALDSPPSSICQIIHRIEKNIKRGTPPVPLVDYTRYIGRDLSMLNKKHKEIFLLKLEGMRNIDIAQKTGLTQWAIANILCSARKRLDKRKQC